MTVMTALLSNLLGAGFSGVAAGFLYYLAAKRVLGMAVSATRVIAVGLIVAVVIYLLSETFGLKWM